MEVISYANNLGKLIIEHYLYKYFCKKGDIKEQ